MTMLLQQPTAERIPPTPIKSAWLTVFCAPDQKTDIPRLKITLELNGEPFEVLLDHYISEDGVISQGNNLTWLLHAKIEGDG